MTPHDLARDITVQVDRLASLRSLRAVGDMGDSSAVHAPDARRLTYSTLMSSWAMPSK